MPEITVPEKLRDALWQLDCNGIPMWELGEDGEVLIAVGHHDKRAFAEACDAYARERWSESLIASYEGGVEDLLDEVEHRRARIVDPPADDYFDFEVVFGEPGDFDVTVWMAP